VLGGVVADPLVRARSASGTGDAVALASVLDGLGLECRVEERDRLAIVQCANSDGVDDLADASRRTAVVDAARSQGFTHVALDLESVVGDAAIRRR
jgi:hypothetical protein